MGCGGSIQSIREGILAGGLPIERGSSLSRQKTKLAKFGDFDSPFSAVHLSEVIPYVKLEEPMRTWACEHSGATEVQVVGHLTQENEVGMPE